MRPTSNPGGQPGALCFAPAEWPQAVAQLAEACFAFDPLERPTFEEAADVLLQAWPSPHTLTRTPPTHALPGLAR